MTTIIFDNKLQKPEPDALAEVLGPSNRLWNDLKRRIAEHYSPLSEEWVFSGKNHGWSLRLKQKKRAILYMTPASGFFRAAFALGEKAVQAAMGSGLPKSVLAIIEAAPKYAEGRGVRIEVHSEPDVVVVEKLAAIKMAN